MKPILKHIAVIACLLPLLFLGLKDTHDWGDDFAQYIIEAKNIQQHQPLEKINYIANPNNIISPICYPPGFPLIMAATSSLHHFDIPKLNVLVSFFLLLIGYFMFVIFHRWYSFFPSLLAVLILVYNPLCLIFKTEILSDLPFTALMLLFFIIYTKPEPKKWHFIICGLLLAFCINMRFAGWIILIAVVADLILNMGLTYFKEKILKYPNWKELLYLAGSFLVLHGIFYFFFPQHITYPENKHTLPIFERIISNATYNLSVYRFYLESYDLKEWSFLSIIISSSIIFLFVLGLVFFILKNKTSQPTLFLVFTLIYTGTVLVHQYGNAGVRLLIPILGFILFFAAFAFREIFTNFIFKGTYVATVAGIVVLCCYYGEDKILVTSKAEIPGPFTREAKSLVNYIKTNVSDKETIMFAKPRALTLVCDKRTIVHSENPTMEILQEEIETFKPDYFLVGYDVSDPVTKSYFEIPTENCK